MPNALPSTTFAVLRATPRSVSSASMVRGTSPPKRSCTARMLSCTARALLRQKFSVRRKGAIASGEAAA